MTSSPSEPILSLVHEACDLAIDCVETGDALIPFVLTEGSPGNPGNLTSILENSPVESLAIAQKEVDELDNRTRAFAFAYDGFVTMEGERSNAIYVEASYAGAHHIFTFVQRYRRGTKKRPAARIGNSVYLAEHESRLRAR
jgi:hypothetical protein